MKIDFFNKYKFKIKNLNSLNKILKNYRAKKKVVMCHGVFDVVHPGHIRHLAFAKSKADILVVSITADKHIKKGKYTFSKLNQRYLNASLPNFEIINLNKTRLDKQSWLSNEVIEKVNSHLEKKDQVFRLNKSLKELFRIPSRNNPFFWKQNRLFTDITITAYDMKNNPVSRFNSLC